MKKLMMLSVLVFGCSGETSSSEPSVYYTCYRATACASTMQEIRVCAPRTQTAVAAQRATDVPCNCQYVGFGCRAVSPEACTASITYCGPDT